jgi:cytochrome c-type biogenesis protein CcmH
MNRFNRLVCVLAALLLAAAAHAQGGAPAKAPPQGFTTTAKPTENDPVSAVCQNQSIAESNADLAVDLRRQVREQIAAGRSDSQIIDFMTQRYGDFVLYSPPLKGTTLLLWFGPFALLLVGALVAWRVVAARKAVVAPAPLSDEERARAAAMLAGERNT